MAIDISGIKPTQLLHHMNMTIGELTVNYYQTRAANSGMINTSIVTSPTIGQISGLYSSRWTGVQYY